VSARRGEGDVVALTDVEDRLVAIASADGACLKIERGFHA
jgi:hypothetical protein